MNLKRTFVALTLLAASASASANLVTNGDFENQPFNIATISGWAITGDTSDVVNRDDGGSNHYFRAGGGPTYLSQTLATSAGGHYNLSIDLMVSNPGANSNIFVDILFGGQLVKTVTDTSILGSGWQNFTLTDLVATGAGTVLTIESQNGGAWNYADNISVNGIPAPEPDTLALMALGLGVLGFARRRQA